ncbi:hypothetical protein DVH05_021311 [Phytophthora capsici]|nr:hypothetical protein DVH05_021311 [Phytophthora capsici]
MMTQYLRQGKMSAWELFDFDESGHAVPKEFTFQHEDDAVTVANALVAPGRSQPKKSGGGQERKDEGNAIPDPKVKNTGRRAEFSIDLLRQAAHETFPFVSKKSPNIIIHTTLARILSPEAFDEAALTRVRELCRRISQEFHSTGDDNTFVVDKLWYVDESHFIRPTGHTTTIP